LKHMAEDLLLGQRYFHPESQEGLKLN